MPCSKYVNFDISDFEEILGYLVENSENTAYKPKKI